MPSFVSSSNRWPLFLLLTVLAVTGCSSEQSSPRKVVEAHPEEKAAPAVDTQKLSELFDVSPQKTKTHNDGAIISFRDVAQLLHVNFQRFSDAVPGRYFLPEVMGGGVAWLDFDCDGYLDLYATSGCPLWDGDQNQTEFLNQLFRSQRGLTFANTTQLSETGDNRYGQGCASGDFNADGFPDLYVTNYGRNTMFLNNGDGTLSDITQSAGTGDESWGTSCVWLDANSDNLADLYVVNYVGLTREIHRVCTYGGVAGYCGPGQWEGIEDILYLNQGDGRFEKAPSPENISVRDAKGLAIAACDFDGDNQAEIYVANDMAPNFLLTKSSNPEPGRASYINRADSSGCAVGGDGRNEASMGISCADFDSDGLVDVFLTHYYQHKNTLYKNLGNLLFEDNSFRSKIAASSHDTLGFGTVALDCDHDGDEDLFIANGHVLGPEHSPNAMKPQLLLNDGRGVLENSVSGIGEYFDQAYLGRGVAKADFDRDGLVDIAVSHLDQPLAILHNETKGDGNFIGIELLPVNRIRPCGGKLIIMANSTRVMPIISGGSYLSSNDSAEVVGLDDYSQPVDVTVVWANGQSEQFSGLNPGRYWCLREGTEGRAILSTNQPVADR